MNITVFWVEQTEAGSLLKNVRTCILNQMTSRPKLLQSPHYQIVLHVGFCDFVLCSDNRASLTSK